MGRGSSKAGGIVGGQTAAGNNNLANITISEKVADNPKFQDSLEILNTLAGEYNTRLGKIDTGVEKAAGDVDISGYTLRINTNAPETSIHEFAHTLANSNADKFGLTDDKEFWKEIKEVKKEYRKNVGQDSNRWISSYEHGTNNVDEFFADAFAHAKLKQMGLTPKKSYGSDYTYSNKVLDITDKYFKKKK